jgi:hypothetical protein
MLKQNIDFLKKLPVDNKEEFNLNNKEDYEYFLQNEKFKNNVKTLANFIEKFTDQNKKENFRMEIENLIQHKKHFLEDFSIIGHCCKIIIYVKQINKLFKVEYFRLDKKYFKIMTTLFVKMILEIFKLFIFSFFTMFTIILLIKNWKKLSKNVKYFVVSLLVLSLFVPYPVLPFVAFLFLYFKI